MSMLALWTWIAVAALVIVPPVVFVLFARDAARILREMAPDAAVEGNGTDEEEGA